MNGANNILGLSQRFAYYNQVRIEDLGIIHLVELILNRKLALRIILFSDKYFAIAESMRSNGMLGDAFLMGIFTEITT